MKQCQDVILSLLKVGDSSHKTCRSVLILILRLLRVLKSVILVKDNPLNLLKLGLSRDKAVKNLSVNLCGLALSKGRAGVQTSCNCGSLAMCNYGMCDLATNAVALVTG